MRTHKTHQIEAQIVDTITCDKCHKLIETVGHPECIKGVSLTFCAGYGSAFDFALSNNSGQENFDLCDECAEELLVSLGRNKNET